MNSKIYCPVCGAENDDGFMYCTRCGAKLARPQYGGSGNDSDSRYEQAEVETPPPAGSPTELDELAAFIGDGSYEYAVKLNHMKKHGKKSSWNWPVFLFGIILGMPFIWFFYRKMKKQGWITLGVCAAFTICSLICVVGILNPLLDVFSSVLPAGGNTGNHISVDYESPFGGSYADYDDDEIEAIITEAFNRYASRFLVLAVVALVLSVGKILFEILLAVYANDMYRRHAEKKIAELKNSGIYNMSDIRIAGGTSVGAAVLSGILFNIAGSVLTMAVAFSSVSRMLSLLFTYM